LITPIRLFIYYHGFFKLIITLFLAIVTANNHFSEKIYTSNAGYLDHHADAAVRMQGASPNGAHPKLH
jgi:hypothetical protein